MIFGAYEAIGFVVSVDALNRFRNSKATASEAPGAEMQAANFVAYNGDRLVTEGEVARLTMTRDRSVAVLEGVSDGKFYNEKGEAFGFAAKTARYQYFQRQLDIEAGGRFWGKDVDIATPAISLNRPQETVKAPGVFAGKLSGGNVKATNLKYSLRNGKWSAGPVKWEGILSLQEQGGPKKRWSVQGESVTAEGRLMTYTKGFATDGEVIVRGDKIVHNRDTEVIVATGNVKYFGVDANMTCPKATVYRNEGRAVFEGGVNMLVKPKGGTKPEEAEIPPLTPYVPDEVKAGRPLPPKEQKSNNEELRNTENLRKYPTSVIAKRVEYWYRKGSRKAIITGDPQARQEIPNIGWRMVWGQSADWNGETDELLVKSAEGAKDARLKMSNGDSFKAFWFKITTQEKSDKWEAKNAEGDFDVDDDEETTTGGGGGSGGSTGGNPPPSMNGRIGA